MTDRRKRERGGGDMKRNEQKIEGMKGRRKGKSK
jgi:hypothetical protein